MTDLHIFVNADESSVLDCDFTVPPSPTADNDDDYDEDDMYFEDYYYDYNPAVKENCNWRSSPEYDHHKTSAHWKVIGNLTDVNIKVALIKGKYIYL